MNEQLRKVFPLLSQQMRGKPVVYLDNAATTPKPTTVIQAVSDYYSSYCANIHRGVYEYSERASNAYEESRKVARDFFSVPDHMSVVFNQGTTSGINIVAHGLAHRLSQGDEIVISPVDHHSNIVPWQIIARQREAHLRYIPIKEDSSFDEEALPSCFSKRTKICAITGMSNVTGYIPPLKKIAELCKAHNTLLLIDGAQLGGHVPIDLGELGCDFLTTSVHKMYGPTGVGILIANTELLESMSPYFYGGGMIDKVDYQSSTLASIPERFEGGTPNIAGVIGTKYALDFLASLDHEITFQHEQMLAQYARKRLKAVDGITVLGPDENICSVCSFIADAVHAHDLGTLVDRAGVAIRTGHHCAQLLMRHFSAHTTSRISFGVYNTKEEADIAITAIENALEMLR